MFPITYRKRFVYTIQGDTRWIADKLRECVVQDLEEEGARNVELDHKRIRFKGNVWSFALVKWHFFYTISRGEVEVDCWDHNLGVGYQISFIDHFIIFLLMMGWWVLVLFGFLRLSVSEAAGTFAVFFCWFGLFYAINVAITYYRFNRFIKSRLREFFNSVAGLGVQSELIVSR